MARAGQRMNWNNRDEYNAAMQAGSTNKPNPSANNWNNRDEYNASQQTGGLSQDDIINKWQQYGPNSGVNREQYDSAVKAKQDAIDAERQAALDAAEAERKRWEEEQAAIAAQMQREQTLLANANGLAANAQSDNASYINTGGGSTISSKLMIGDENIKRRKGSGTVSASLGL